jgi:hypothetical protein
VAESEGKPVSGLALKAGAALNVGALNLDKAVQMAKKAKKGKSNEAQG